MTAALIFFITRVLCPASHFPAAYGRRSRSSTLPDPLTHPGESLATRSRLIPELLIFGGALLFGLIGVPLLIWLAGSRILGPYTHGANPNAGPMALLGDFFAGLQHGYPTFWIVVIGPAVLIAVARLAWALIRR